MQSTGARKKESRGHLCSLSHAQGECSDNRLWGEIMTLIKASENMVALIVGGGGGEREGEAEAEKKEVK